MQEVCGWINAKATKPVWAKMTPNITDIAFPARTALTAGCEGVAAINTITSVMGINLETLRPEPSVEGYTTPGGYSSRAVKPIALAKVTALSGKSVSKLAKNCLPGQWSAGCAFTLCNSASACVHQHEGTWNKLLNNLRFKTSLTLRRSCPSLSSSGQILTTTEICPGLVGSRQDRTLQSSSCWEPIVCRYATRSPSCSSFFHASGACGLLQCIAAGPCRMGLALLCKPLVIFLY